MKVHFLRTVTRLLWVSLWIARALFEAILLIRINPLKARAARSSWIKRTAQRILGAMNVKVNVHGIPPQSGLLVSNHLSYLDILVLASVAPAVFVAKSEVRNWPVFGWLARCAGTIFIKRESRSQVAAVAGKIDRVLERGELVILFPEGTSSNGRSVLPFRSSLLAPVLLHNFPVSACALDYQLRDGSVETEVCYWGDMILGPHLLNLLTKDGVNAMVAFGGGSAQAFMDRKQLAKALHASVCSLRINAPASRLL